MARKLVLSLAVFMIVFCLGMSMMAMVGAGMLVSERLAAPTQVLPVP